MLRLRNRISRREKKHASLLPVMKSLAYKTRDRDYVEACGQVRIPFHDDDCNYLQVAR